VADDIVVAAVQSPTSRGDAARNVDVLVEQVSRCAADGIKLVVFPECGLTGYVADSRQEATDIALPQGSEYLRTIADAASAAGVIAVFGYLERTPDGDLYNTAALAGPTGLWATYRKVHLPAICADRFVDAGSSGPTVVQTPLGRIGLGICYDLRFPEWTRVLALKGADILAQPTNWAITARQWAELLPAARAFENHMAVIVCNRADIERDVDFIGRSVIADANGVELARATKTDDRITATLTLDGSARTQRDTVFARRRPDQYQDIVRPST
jgi:predicted amidohydrolase